MALLHRRETDVPQPSLWSRFDWQRFLILWAAVFHAAVAVTLAAAPYWQILNAGTAPVFALASRYLWALLFAIAAASTVAMLLTNYRPALQMLTWLTVFPLGGTWLAAFTLAVLHGQGSALSVIVWPALYGPFALAAIRIGLGRR